MKKNKTVVITLFGSGYAGERTDLYKNAGTIGSMIAKSGWILCNGGYGGIMEASAKGCKEAGGKVIGITCKSFQSKPNPYLTEEIKTESLVERLMKLVDMADGYVLLPGGTGTLLELAAIWEHINKGFMTRKPAVALGSYWSSVVELVGQELVREGKAENSRLISFGDLPSDLVYLLHTGIENEKK